MRLRDRLPSGTEPRLRIKPRASPARRASTTALPPVPLPARQRRGCRHVPGGARADTPNPALSPAAQGATAERTANPDPAVRPPAPPVLTGVSSRSPSIPAAPPPAGSAGAAASPAWRPGAGGAGVRHNRIVPHDGERARHRAPPLGRDRPSARGGRSGPHGKSAFLKNVGFFVWLFYFVFSFAKRHCECRPFQRRGVSSTSPLRALPLIASSGNGDVTQVCVCPWGQKHDDTQGVGRQAGPGHSKGAAGKRQAAFVAARMKKEVVDWLCLSASPTLSLQHASIGKGAANTLSPQPEQTKILLNLQLLQFLARVQIQPLQIQCCL